MITKNMKNKIKILEQVLKNKKGRLILAKKLLRQILKNEEKASSNDDGKKLKTLESTLQS